MGEYPVYDKDTCCWKCYRGSGEECQLKKQKTMGKGLTIVYDEMAGVNCTTVEKDFDLNFCGDSYSCQSFQSQNIQTEDNSILGLIPVNGTDEMYVGFNKACYCCQPMKLKTENKKFELQMELIEP